MRNNWIITTEGHTTINNKHRAKYECRLDIDFYLGLAYKEINITYRRDIKKKSAYIIISIFI